MINGVCNSRLPRAETPEAVADENSAHTPSRHRRSAIRVLSQGGCISNYQSSIFLSAPCSGRSQLSTVARPANPMGARPAHGGSRGGWHAACPSTCPAPPRSRFGGADYELLERARHGTLGPSDSEATLLQLDRPAVRRSSKHEVAFIFTPHDGSE